MSAADLMARIDASRGDHQRANDLIAEARDRYKPPETPPPPPDEGIDIGSIAHTALDFAGFIPGVGVVADLANAALYAAEGDYKNAALSAAAAIPGAGDAAAAAKLGARAFDAAQTVRRGAEAVDTAEGVAEGVDQAEQGNYEGVGLAAMGAAAFGAGGGRRGRDSDGSDGDGGDGGDYDRYEDLAEQHGYGNGGADYESRRQREYGDMSQNQRENSDFNRVQREVEREIGREFTRDERREIHDRGSDQDGKIRDPDQIREQFREKGEDGSESD